MSVKRFIGLVQKVARPRGRSRRSQRRTPLEQSEVRLDDDHLTDSYDAMVSLACHHSSEAYDDQFEHGVLVVDALTDAQAVVTMLPKGKRAVVAFRGSSSKTDWRHNMMVPLQCLPAPRCTTWQAHTGFVKQYTAIHESVLQILRNGGVQRVLLCGHSLGGALAVISAAMLPEDLACDLVTFGSPRPGNRALASGVSDRCDSCVRVVRDRDIVPLMPLEIMGYSHVCEPWLRVSDNGRIDRIERERSTLWQMINRVAGTLSLDFGIRDHSMDGYLMCAKQGAPTALEKTRSHEADGFDDRLENASRHKTPVTVDIKAHGRDQTADERQLCSSYTERGD